MGVTSVATAEEGDATAEEAEGDDPDGPDDRDQPEDPEPDDPDPEPGPDEDDDPEQDPDETDEPDESDEPDEERAQEAAEEQDQEQEAEHRVQPVIESLTVSPGGTVGPEETVTVAGSFVGDGEFVVYESRNVTEIDRVGPGPYRHRVRARDAAWVTDGYGVTVEAELDGEVVDRRHADAPTARQPLRPTIAEVEPADPVGGEDACEVTVRIENEAHLQWTGPNRGEFTLAADGRRVGSTTASVGWDETETVTFEWEPDAVSDETTVTLEVSGPDYADSTTVAVAPHRPPTGGLGVDLVWTNTPVYGGEHLWAYCRVTNNTSRTRRETVRLWVGEAGVLDRTVVTVAPGRTEGVWLGFETYPVRRHVRFPIWAGYGNTWDGRYVRVWRARRYD